VASTEEAAQIKDTFLKAQYLVPLVVLSLAQACNNGFYYTVQYSLDDYGYRFEVNMLVIGCLEFLSCFFTNFFCHRMKRRLWIVVLMLLSGAFGVCVEFSNSQAGDLVLIGCSRLLNTVAFALFSRSTGLGVSEAMSNLGNMAAPFLVTLANFSQLKAVFIGGFFNIGGGLAMLIVKETKKDAS
jgi:hypothetical protein